MDTRQENLRHTGKPHTPETRARISAKLKGIKRGRPSIEHIEKVASANRGRKHTEESKIKMREAIKIYWDKKGRKTYPPYKHKNMLGIYKDWRRAVFERDKYTCRWCNRLGCYLEAHHIKSYTHYPELRYVVENGLTLCKECHALTDNYKIKGHA